MGLLSYLNILFYISFSTDAQLFGLSSMSTRVIGGSPTSIEQYPVIAQLLLDTWGKKQFTQYCAGVILTAHHIISAAHCFQYNKDTGRNYSLPKYWKLRVGSTYRSRGGTLESIKKFIIHPGFDKGFYTNDISVIVTTRALSFNNNVRQATIPQYQSEIKDDAVVTLIGWGTTKIGGDQSEHLLKVNMLTINREICSERYSKIGAAIGDTMMCAGKLDGGGVDGCYGDSGGPLIYNGFIVGLVSFGYACGHSYYPGVYTKISHFTEWILKIVANS